MQLLEHDLDFLSIGRAHGDEMKTLYAHHEPSLFSILPELPTEFLESLTLAFFTSSGVSASKRCDMLGVFGRILRFLTLSIGVLALR